MARARTGGCVRWVSSLPSPLLILFWLIGACGQDLRAVEYEPSTAFENHLETQLGRIFEEAAAQHPDQSGFSIVRHGRKAFTARIALADLAEHSLDVPYYWYTVAP
jgi:putative cardiolipin synthase